MIDSDFGQIMREKKFGLTVSTRVERILPDTVTYVLRQNIMLPVFLRIFKIRPNPLNLKTISIYSQKIKFCYYFKGLDPLAT